MENEIRYWLADRIAAEITAEIDAEIIRDLRSAVWGSHPQHYDAVAAVPMQWQEDTFFPPVRKKTKFLDSQYYEDEE